MMYVIMNKYNNTFYKECHSSDINIWTMNIKNAKTFSNPADAKNNAYCNNIDTKEIIIVEI